ncbi:tectonic-2-like [Pollicipes pollicipes]|uniref:tectonic-2-like n=1 Tax=Pollicipes pollicipes TaxID=41117 RepID=UPI0018851A79|nr:tectonic-2-like [Pollicipes pollicipes]
MYSPLFVWLLPFTTLHAVMWQAAGASAAAAELNLGRRPVLLDSAVCECDLTGARCDPHCCCDPDCADTAAPCPRADRLGPPAVHRCSAANRPPWHSVFCVVADNSPFLGSFHKLAPAADLSLFSPPLRRA